MNEEGRQLQKLKELVFLAMPGNEFSFIEKVTGKKNHITDLHKMVYSTQKGRVSEKN